MTEKSIVLKKESVKYKATIGRRGEFDVTTLSIDVSAYVEAYGEGEAVLMVRNPQEMETYSVPLDREGNVVKWLVGQESTILSGKGYAVLEWYPNDGGEARTANIELYVEPSAIAKGTPLMAQIEALRRKIEEIQAEGIDNEAIQRIISDYLLEHPIEGVTVEAVDDMLKLYVKNEELGTKLADYVEAHREELRGPQGLQGEPGPAGADGQPGEQGPKGDPGETTYIENPYNDTSIKKTVDKLEMTKVGYVELVSTTLYFYDTSQKEHLIKKFTLPTVEPSLSQSTLSDIAANTGARHVHHNKTVLDGITTDKVEKWDSNESYDDTELKQSLDDLNDDLSTLSESITEISEKTNILFNETGGEVDVPFELESGSISGSTGANSGTNQQYNRTIDFLHSDKKLIVNVDTVTDPCTFRIFRYTSPNVSTFANYIDWRTEPFEAEDGAYYRVVVKRNSGYYTDTHPTMSVKSVGGGEKTPSGYAWKTTEKGAGWVLDEREDVDLSDIRNTPKDGETDVPMTFSAGSISASAGTVSNDNAGYAHTDIIHTDDKLIISVDATLYKYGSSGGVFRLYKYGRNTESSYIGYEEVKESTIELIDGLYYRVVVQLKSGSYFTDFTNINITAKSVSAGRKPVGYSWQTTEEGAGWVKNKSDILYGKKWAVCGDSFTNGSESGKLEDGKYRGFSKTYPYFIGNRTGIEVLDFNEGGRTLAYPSNSQGFTNSLTAPNAEWNYQNIPVDVDYITIYLGINDDENHHGYVGSGPTDSDGEDITGYIPLGTIDDTTVNSYYGAWNVVLSWLIVNRPKAHIGIIVTNGSTQNIRNATIEIARKYGIAYIDLNGDQRTPAMIRTCNPDIAQNVKDALKLKWRVSSSNTHPNDDAHLYESYFIENFLRSI